MTPEELAAREMATQNWELFRQHVIAGFTEAQAMYLIGKVVEASATITATQYYRENPSD